MRMTLLKLLWSLEIIWHRIWFSRDLMVLGGISDSDFLHSLGHWRDHPSMLIRTMCGRRWARVTWPKDDVMAHEEDVRLLWERRKEGGA